MNVLLVVGTEKGAWLVRSDESRAKWSIEGPAFKGWRVTAAARDRNGRTFLGVTSFVYGTTVQVSDDLESWRQITKGPSYPENGPRKLQQIWRFLPDRDGRVYAGVAEAGLFLSEDRGESWSPVAGLNDHPTREAWLPGAGGLCAHSILAAGDRLWCGISSAGVFRSDDGGRSWHAKNTGVPVIAEDKVHKDIGY